ncbi:hypothetical protein, partial [Streptomyces zaomyceticus]|uniref:hypothetical protein n=1 Tax=Streptomyces zaomyceticus TaxID=68286 RepID=UPI0036C923AF
RVRPGDVDALSGLVRDRVRASGEGLERLDVERLEAAYLMAGGAGGKSDGEEPAAIGAAAEGESDVRLFTDITGTVRFTVHEVVRRPVMSADGERVIGVSTTPEKDTPLVRGEALHGIDGVDELMVFDEASGGGVSTPLEPTPGAVLVYAGRGGNVLLRLRGERDIELFREEAALLFGEIPELLHPAKRLIELVTSIRDMTVQPDESPLLTSLRNAPDPKTAVDLLYIEAAATDPRTPQTHPATTHITPAELNDIRHHLTPGQALQAALHTKPIPLTELALTPAQLAVLNSRRPDTPGWKDVTDRATAIAQQTLHPTPDTPTTPAVPPTP